jgi:hypothetical protein
MRAAPRARQAAGCCAPTPESRPGIAEARRAIALAPKDALGPRTLQWLERQHVRDISSAIESANRGQLAEAVAKLDRLIPAITNPQILHDARKLREDMAKHAKP